ncbi:hypothetical protein [Sphingomonas sp. BK069]|uniref:hypothetical protein n=1 Tax=Sphingomonas sp. BK069 TaxID=2586979 RepID=UPI001615CDDF|nr:hypothetical protein [Sphingomonas sp. BK069]MBB3348390.1 hypothetical protein [Sphingomonas sp. BK069]
MTTTAIATSFPQPPPEDPRDFTAGGNVPFFGMRAILSASAVDLWIAELSSLTFEQEAYLCD